MSEDYFTVKNKLDDIKDDNIKMTNKNDLDKANEIFDNFLENYKSVDKNNIKETFRNLFENESKYQEHLNRRIGFGHINKNNPEKDYFNKTIDCIKNCDIIILEEYQNFWQKLYFSKKNNWLVIINYNGILVTSYKTDREKLLARLEEGKKTSGINQKEINDGKEIKRKASKL
ncbi:MAG: hypothetical protein KA885_12980 [Spirochaetes bacterium]|nr:hypothetical protein [Spirochaetota bacterium]